MTEIMVKDCMNSMIVPRTGERKRSLTVNIIDRRLEHGSSVREFVNS